MQTSLSLAARSQTDLCASHLSMFQLQAEHQHAAELIDLLFKGRFTCFYSCFATQAGCQQALLKIHYYTSACIICVSANN